jgi:hypothetical protein
MARRRPSRAKRALHDQIDRARAELDGTPPLRDVSVHEARKELKRARAALRLLRDTIGDARYRRANRQLRDAARPLSRVRDAKVLLEAADQLRSETKKSGHRAELDSLRRRLRRERQQARSEVRSALLRRIRRSLESARSSSARWRDPTEDSLRHAVERLYRKGRKAFARAKAEPCEATLHESRKQTKYLGKALEILATKRSGGLTQRVKRADRIADALGRDHDLALLQGKLRARRRSQAAGHSLHALIERRRRRLQRKAEAQSLRLYDPKPKAFVDAIDRDPATRRRSRSS